MPNTQSTHRSLVTPLFRLTGLAAVLALHTLSTGALLAQDAAPAAAASPPAPATERLLDAGAAAQLDLTDEQRNQISVLWKERTAAIQAAAAADKETARQQADQKILDILTAEQRQQFTELNPEPKLKFNFRFQKWTDVLEWFAEQSGLSLVLDAPPPGTFNYSDSREYTPTEAIDILNGVLQTKGYTLVRRKRMLIVIDLKQGLPETLVPRVTLEELDKRGRFEFVSVMFPLGARPAEEVESEITPLLGQYGKAVPLVKTKQILVTDMAGIMRAVSVIVESIPEPKAPDKPKPPEPAEKPELKVYPLETNDPDAAIETLQKLFGGVNFVRDPKAEQINAYATPTQHAGIAKVIEQLKAGEATTVKSRLEIYATDRDRTAELIETIKLAVPDAQLRADSQSGGMIAFASEKDHEKIKSALDRLGQAGAPQQSRQLEVYPMVKGDPGAALSLLQTLVPGARLTVDSTSQSIIAVAIPADQQVIKATIEQIENSKPATARGKEIRFYPFKKSPPSSLLPVVQSLVPQAQVTVDSDGKRWTVVATPEDHEAITSTVKRFVDEEKSNTTTEDIRFYPFKKAPPSSLLPIVQSLVPQAQVTVDSDGRRWTVLATPEDHEVVATTAKKFMDIEYAKVDEKSLLQIYQVSDLQKNRLEALKPGLSKELFEVKFLPEVNPGEMMVWAKARQHQFLKGILEELKQEVPAEAQKQLAGYSTGEADPAAVTSAVQQLFPQVQVISDTATKRLMIFATADDHAKIAAAMQKIVAEKPLDGQPLFHVYKVRAITAGEAITALQPLVPSARLSVDTKTGNVVAFGTPAEHRLLAQAVKTLGTETSPQETPQLEVYRLTKADPQTVLALLQPLLPQARLSVDATQKTIIAYAVPADQQVVQSTIEQLQGGDSGAHTPRLQFYTMEKPPSASLLAGLQQLVPQAQVSYDAETKKLMVVARPTDHEMVKSTIDRAAESNATIETNQLEIYAVTPAQRKRFMGIYDSVQSELPGIRVITDAEPGELAIWAKPSQHLVLAEIVNKVAQENGEKAGYKLVAYPIKASDPTSALTVIQDLFPGTRIVLDAKTRRLLIWTSEEEHQLIKQSMDQVNADIGADMLETFRFYPLKGGNPDIAIGMLQPLLIDARMMSDREAGGLMAWAREADHEIIAQTVNQIEQSAKLKDGRTVAIYTAGDANRSQLMSLLTSLVPEARIDSFSTLRKIVAWATPEEHRTIAATVEKVVGEEAAVGPAELKIYRVKSVTSTTAMQILQPIVPDATYNGGADGKSVIVWARANEHQKIAAIIKQVEELAATRVENSVFAVYPLHGATGTTLTQLLAHYQTKGATFISDTERDSLIVRATEKMQAEIAAAIEDLTAKLPKTNKPFSRVYSFKNADAYAGYLAIGALVPTARLSVDQANHTVAVNALEEDHRRVQELVTELDRQGEGKAASVMRAYHVETIDTNTLVGMLNQLFGRFANIRFTNDQRTGTVAAFATEEQHAKIKQVIDEFGKNDNANISTVYKFKTADPYAAMTVLQTLIPNARMAVDQRNRSLVVGASPAEHKRIKATIDEMEGDGDTEGGLVLRSYPVLDTDPSNALTMLRTLFTQHPEVQISLDVYNDTLVALATVAQHERIHEALGQVEKNGQLRTTRVYQFKNADANSASTFARTIAPRAAISYDYRTESLVVSATAGEHKKIQQAVEELEAAAGGENAPVLKSYSIKKAEPNIASSMLQTMFARMPEVRISLDTQGRSIVVLARADQQMQVKAALDEIEGNSAGRESKVYHFQRADPNTALNAIRAVVPSAQMGVDTSTRSLVVSALPAEHEIIASVIDQMDGTQEGQIPELRSYPLGTANPQNALSMLQTLFATRPEIRVSVDTQTGNIMALASPAQHKTIEKAVAQIREGGDERKSVVYRLQHADPNSTSVALQGLVPFARVVFEPRTRSVVVSGTPDEQALVAKTIEQIDGREGDGQAPVLKSYRVRSANPNTIGRMLNQLFSSYPEVQISADREGEAVVAIAPPALHKQIQLAIDEADSASGFDDDVALESYPLEGIDADAAQTVLEDLTKKQSGQVVLTIDRQSNQLFVMADEKQQALIRDTLSRLKTERPEIEVFQLEAVDPITAEIAIDRLFSVDGYTLVPNAPLVDSDEETQQLFVRGTLSQMDQIRALLVKMGETQLAVATVGSQKTLRVIPFEGDTRAAVREIERVWPKLRRNSIRVVVPSAVAPTLRRFQLQQQQQPANEESNESQPAPGGGQFSVDDDVTPSDVPKSASAEPDSFEPVDFESDRQSPQKPTPESAETPAADAESRLSPVIIAPGDDSITISSDDLKALDELESLLRSMSQPTSRIGSSSRGRDYIVFSLKNASAKEVADSLEDLFRNQRGSGGAGRRRSNDRVQIVPDERLNAIIVYANRADREVIEDLLEVLDTANVPVTTSSNQPVVIQIKNTDAERVESIVRDVYTAQLSQGGGRRALPVPTGVSEDTTLAIEQYNAAISAPLLTMSVDDLTNSLIVTGPPQLVKEVRSLAAELDSTAAEGTTREMNIVPLKKVNSQVVQDALDVIFGDSGGSGRSVRARDNDRVRNRNRNRNSGRFRPRR